MPRRRSLHRTGRYGKRIRKTFSTRSAAKLWRSDALVAVQQGTLRPVRAASVREVADQWLAEAKRGVITNRSGDRYKPSAIRAYRQSLTLRVLPVRAGHPRRRAAFRRRARRRRPRTLNGAVLAATAAGDVQARAAARRAHDQPDGRLRLPAIRGGRDKIVSPEQAAVLLDALPDAHDRALWGTALYAGLRRGELLALQWEDVDIAEAQIRVSRSWDVAEGCNVGPKSAVGRRRVPIASGLKALLAAHRLGSARATGHVSGTTGTGVAAIRQVTKGADDAWQAAGLERITLHEARHTYASLMIAAGVNAKALSTYMGHANISITLDRSGHLMPDNEAEAATLLDAYLDSARG